MAPFLKRHWIGLIAGVAVIMVGAIALPRFVAAPDLDENRKLAGPPALPHDLAGLAGFRKATDAYVADRFPPRALLIGALNRLRLAAGVSGSPRVIVGRDGWLFSDDGSHLGAARGEPRMSPADTTAWLTGLAGRTETLAGQGRAYAVLVAPVKEAVYPQQAPGWFGVDPNRPAMVLGELAEGAGAGHVVYPLEPIAKQARWGLTAYAAHDTHWTGLGAYIAYAELMSALQRQGVGDGPRPLAAFQESRRYEINKPRNLALMLGVASFVDVDYPELDDPAASQQLKVSWLSPVEDWTAPRVIDTGAAGKPVLLITMDSFSNALLPFLYGDFSRIVVAHNKDGAWRPDLIGQFAPNAVVSEIVESGVGLVMAGSPAPAPQTAARVRQYVAARRLETWDHTLQRPTRPGPPRIVQGDEGTDRLEGDDRREEMQGRQGDDTLNGQGGDDLLRGGRGRDLLDGGEGDDYLAGGRDADTLRGGRGADTFNSFAQAGDDVVLDFFAREGDRVELDAQTAYTVAQEGADTVVHMEGARLILRGVTLADLPTGWIRTR